MRLWYSDCALSPMGFWKATSYLIRNFAVIFDPELCSNIWPGTMRKAHEAKKYFYVPWRPDSRNLSSPYSDVATVHLTSTYTLKMYTHFNPRYPVRTSDYSIRNSSYFSLRLSRIFPALDHKALLRLFSLSNVSITHTWILCIKALSTKRLTIIHSSSNRGRDVFIARK